jgi:hypothetical protein
MYFIKRGIEITVAAIKTKKKQGKLKRISQETQLPCERNPTTDDN